MKSTAGSGASAVGGNIQEQTGGREIGVCASEGRETTSIWA